MECEQVLVDVHVGVVVSVWRNCALKRWVYIFKKIRNILVLGLAWAPRRI